MDGAGRNKAKVLLMGRARAGKTSMKSIIFANYMARETGRFQTTYQVEHNSLKFLGNRGLNLWDCGGQDVFMENYFESQKETIFDRVEVLIYVLVAEGEKKGRGGHEAKSADVQRDLQYFKNAMDALRQYSPNATVFVLIHKMDLIQENRREEVLQNYQKQLEERRCDFDVTCFGTSIWDASLFKAWSSIVHLLIPDIGELQKQLEHVCQVCEADEVVLFERNTFLLITHATRRHMPDVHRFEKISNIVKQFKLSCGKMKTTMETFTVTNSSFTATIEQFLDHSFIMVVVSDPSIHSAATSANLWACRKHFCKLTSQGSGVAFSAHL